jgi:hypothetical protein
MRFVIVEEPLHQLVSVQKEDISDELRNPLLVHEAGGPVTAKLAGGIALYSDVHN